MNVSVLAVGVVFANVVPNAVPEAWKALNVVS
jgi:hypothetical protein